MRIWLAALAGISGAAPASAVPYERIDFATGERRQVELAEDPRSSRSGNIGAQGGAPLALPKSPPTLPVRNSGFSTLFRARSVFDLSQYPARAVAKLYQLTDAGTRSGAACTATFIGPRHLLTARHCIADPHDGIVRHGFELAVRHDRGRAEGVMRVTGAWIEREQLRPQPLEMALVAPERCSDFAVIEIVEPVGAQVGWLPMRDQDPVGSSSGEGALFHRFSYPHQSAADILRARIEGGTMPPGAKAMLEAMLEEAASAEPEFSPDNLYYEFGTLDEAQGRYLADRNGYTTPGRSGSSLLNGAGEIVGILSRSYGGATYSCRLTKREIAAIADIIDR